MAEWSKAAVLKTVSRQRDVGSNPTPSAITSLRAFFTAPACKNDKSDGAKGIEVYGEMAE